MRPATALVLGVLVLLPACGPQHAAPRAGIGDRQPADSILPGEEIRMGRVATAGTESAPFTVLQTEDGGTISLTGELEPELGRLSGATVRVIGQPTVGFPGTALNVRHYEVLSIHGQTPHVGTLQVRDGAVWLAGKDTVRLVAPPGALQTLRGAKVWIVGPSTEGGLGVQSYGIIREG